MVKKTIFLIFAVFLSVLSINFASAVILSAGPINFNRTASTLINITLNNTNTYNITQVSITLPADATYIGHYNGTDTSVDNATFIVANVSGQTVLIWRNVTAGGLIPNISMNQVNGVMGGVKSFWFNVSFATAGDKTFTVTENITAHANNQTNQVLTVNFAFQGRIKNETGQYTGKVNVSLYQFVTISNGPPVEKYTASTISDASGIFNFTSINGSGTQYKIKMVLSNSSDANCYSTNSTCPAEKTGTVLPPFPAMMFYPPQGAETLMDFSLNGTTFYLQPAATLRLYANNGSIPVMFGYEVMDQKVGFPIESNARAKLNTTDVIVPAGRTYSVMLMREFTQFNYSTACVGNFFNDTMPMGNSCPAPPVSNSSLGTLTAGQIMVVNQSLTTSIYRLYGCMGIAEGHVTTQGYNNTIFNITQIKVRPVSWVNLGQLYVPLSMESKVQRFNYTDTTMINNSNSSGYASTIGVNCPNSLAAYNISVMGSTTGMTYVLEAYASNVTASEKGGGGSIPNYNGIYGKYLAGFSNITITGNTAMNLTLYSLTGTYANYSQTSTEPPWYPGYDTVNTKFMKINIKNSTGQAVTTSMHVEVKIKNTNTGTGITNYMIETLTNGTFYLPILNNSNWAEVSVFPDNSPPIKKTLNLSLSENNVTLVKIDFAAGGDKGMRKMNSSGGLEMMNVSTSPILIRFLLRGTDTEITSMNATSFNPLKALVAGSVDLELKDATSSVVMRFNNFDMFSAKQPPMFAVMDNNAVTTLTQTWKFGNFVPKEVYDNVTIIIPYESSLNESWNYNISIPTLYTEDSSISHQFSTAWSSTSGYTDANLTDEFLDYNSTRYRNYLASGGMLCSKTDASSACYMNTSGNTFVIEIPHFSGLSPALSYVDTATSTGTTSSSSSSGVPFWTGMYTITNEQLTEGYTKDLAIAQRVKFKIDNLDHYVGISSLTATQATINVSSPISQEAVFNIGDEKKFEVTNDNYYDVLVKLLAITNNRANITVKYIHEAMPEGAIGTSGEAAEDEETILDTSLSPKPKWIVAIISVVILIGVVVFWFYYRKKRYYHKGY